MYQRQLDLLEPEKGDDEPPAWETFPERERAKVVDRLACLMARIAAAHLENQPRTKEKRHHE